MNNLWHRSKSTATRRRSSDCVSNRQLPTSPTDRIAPIPLLILHGDADRVVSPHHADALYERAAEPKQLWHIAGARHIEAVWQPELRQRLVVFLVDATRGNDRGAH